MPSASLPSPRATGNWISGSFPSAAGEQDPQALRIVCRLLAGVGLADVGHHLIRAIGHQRQVFDLPPGDQYMMGEIGFADDAPQRAETFISRVAGKGDLPRRAGAPFGDPEAEPEAIGITLRQWKDRLDRARTLARRPLVS